MGNKSKKYKQSKEKSTFKDFFFMMIILVPSLLTFMAFILFLLTIVKDDLNDDTVAIFNKGKNLKCYTSNHRISLYLVSKNSGWNIYENEYFKKGDILVKADRCE